MGKRRIERSKEFDKALKHIKDKNLKIRVSKQIKKIIDDPKIGNFLGYGLKGVRKVYIKPFRMLYIYDEEKDIIKLLDFDKRDKIYKKY